MSGDTYPADAGLLHDSRSKNIQGAGKLADRLRCVAGDQQDMLYPCGAQLLKCGTQCLRIRHAPYRNVPRRVKPGALHGECRMDHLTEAGVRRMRHVDTGTAREHGLEFRQTILLLRSNFGGRATHEGHDATFEVIRRRRRMTCLTVGDHKCPGSEMVAPIL